MAQDPEPEESREDQEAIDREELETLDPSHELDMVTLYVSPTFEAEMEADTIRGVLDSNGIPSLMIRGLHSPLSVEVQVPRMRLQEARRAIEEAQAAGPEAAAEAEAASEEAQ